MLHLRAEQDIAAILLVGHTLSSCGAIGLPCDIARGGIGILGNVGKCKTLVQVVVTKLTERPWLLPEGGMIWYA